MAFSDKINLGIDIASEFTGRKAFQQAESATTGLDKAVTKLGKKLAGAFSAYKIYEFSKASIKAFADDQKAAALLANELKNVGLALSTPAAEKFIANMQKQTGVLDDELRPAYSQLIRVMGSTEATQKAMATAFDVASGTGADYKSVVNALSQAYVGNVKGLKALNTGLTQTELKTKTYAELIDILNKKFAGAGAASLDTYAGKMKILQATVADAMETVGQGFVDAFTQIANDKDFTTVTDGISNMAENVANTLVGVGALLDKVRSKFESMPSWVKRIFETDAFKNVVLGPTSMIQGYLSKLGSKTITSNAMPSGIQNFLDEQNTRTRLKDEAKAARDAALRAKQLADAIKKQAQAQADLLKKKKEAAALDALSLKYKQAASIFDMEQVQLAAASMAKQTDEDYARIKLKQDLITLQNAINAGDLKAAEAAAKVVEEDYKRVWAYQAQNIALGYQQGIIQNLQNAAKLIPQDLNLINLENLKSALDYIKDMLAKLANLPKGTSTTVTGGGTGGNGGGSGGGGAVGGGISVTNVYGVGNPNLFTGSGVYDYKSPFSYGYGNPNLLANSGVFNSMSGYDFGNANPNLYTSSGVYNQPTVVVQITDNAQKLVDAVTFATQNTSANGTPIMLSRNATNLAW